MKKGPKLFFTSKENWVYLQKKALLFGSCISVSVIYMELYQRVFIEPHQESPAYGSIAGWQQEMLQLIIFLKTTLRYN